MSSQRHAADLEVLHDIQRVHAVLGGVRHHALSEQGMRAMHADVRRTDRTGLLRWWLMAPTPRPVQR
jgi:hypothetical protein